MHLIEFTRIFIIQLILILIYDLIGAVLHRWSDAAI